MFCKENGTEDGWEDGPLIMHSILSFTVFKKCCVAKCNKSTETEPNCTFAPLPNSKDQHERFVEWLSLIGRADLLQASEQQLDAAFVCQRHFAPLASCKQPLLLTPNRHLPHPAAGGPRAQAAAAQQPSAVAIYNYFVKKVPDTKALAYVNFKDYCLNLYHCCPVLYKALRESLKLLPLSALRGHVRRAAAQPGADTRLLRYKTAHMSPRQRHCVLCVGAVDLQPGFYYNIRSDTIVGIGEGADELAQSSTARVAALAGLRGLLADWRLPLAHTQRRALEPRALADWLDITLAQLPQWKVLVHAVVAPLAPPYYHAAALRGVTQDLPYLEIGPLKISFVFDTKSVMQNVHYHLMRSNIIYKNKAVKWEHITQFFNLSKTFKMSLTPGLTESEVSGEAGGAVPGRPVARSLSVLAQLGALPAAAGHTADFLAGVHDVRDLCASRLAHSGPRKRTHTGEDHQYLQKIQKCLEFLDQVSVGVDIGNPDAEVNFINAFKINLNSIKNIRAKLKEYDLDDLPTSRLASCSDDITQQINGVLQRRGCRSCTSQNFISAFNDVLVTHFMRPNSLSVTNQKIEDFLSLLENGLAAFKPDGGTLVLRTSAPAPLVDARSYRRLQLPAVDAARYLAGFLLVTCLGSHQKCPKFRMHVLECCVAREKCAANGYTIPQLWRCLKGYEEYVVQPPLQVLMFLQRMEMMFRLVTGAGAAPTLAALREAAGSVTLRARHCDCFPVYIFKLLFLRVRLFLTLKHNNAALRREPEGRDNFSTKGLEFDFLAPLSIP